MRSERLVKPGESTGGMDQRAGECSVRDGWRRPEDVKHGRPEMARGVRNGFAVRSRAMQNGYGGLKPNTPKKIALFAASQSAGAAPSRPAMTDRSSVASFSNRTTD